MDISLSAQLSGEWSGLLSQFPPAVRLAARRLAAENNEQLATHFYAVMLEDQIAHQFLTHEKVKSALHSSMKKWVVTIFELDAGSDLEPMVQEQIHVGMVHARVNVPVHVVLRGARSLKQKYAELLATADHIDHTVRTSVLSFISLSIDFAMEIMAGAYASTHDRSARAEESYRLFSMAQDVTAEKEHQRAALLNWENSVMYEHALNRDAVKLPRIGASDFGLWFKHKGAHVFQGSYESDVIITAMTDLDSRILPALGQEDGPLDPSEQVERVRELHAQARVVGTHLERLFEQRNELEAGRDALTRLLSRRFLDVILSKEVNYARHSGTTFALVAIDIDFFKDVNDTYGHDSGDMVLQQFAQLLNEQTRGGDYVFRLGGEEFLVLLVDVQREAALRVAEKLRQNVMEESFRVRHDTMINITVSIGVALHDGHPDHSRILRSADDALYRAKNGGRNSVVVAEDQVISSTAGRPIRNRVP